MAAVPTEVAAISAATILPFGARGAGTIPKGIAEACRLLHGMPQSGRFAEHKDVGYAGVRFPRRGNSGQPLRSAPYRDDIRTATGREKTSILGGLGSDRSRN